MFTKRMGSNALFHKQTHHANHHLMKVGNFIKAFEVEHEQKEHKHHHALEKA
jgi:hypothetical protein